MPAFACLATRGALALRARVQRSIQQPRLLERLHKSSEQCQQRRCLRKHVTCRSSQAPAPSEGSSTLAATLHVAQLACMVYVLGIQLASAFERMEVRTRTNSHSGTRHVQARVQQPPPSLITPELIDLQPLALVVALLSGYGLSLLRSQREYIQQISGINTANQDTQIQRTEMKALSRELGKIQGRVLICTEQLRTRTRESDGFEVLATGAMQEHSKAITDLKLDTQGLRNVVNSLVAVVSPPIAAVSMLSTRVSALETSLLEIRPSGTSRGQSTLSVGSVTSIPASGPSQPTPLTTPSAAQASMSSPPSGVRPSGTSRDGSSESIGSVTPIPASVTPRKPMPIQTASPSLDIRPSGISRGQSTGSLGSIQPLPAKDRNPPPAPFTLQIRPSGVSRDQPTDTMGSVKPIAKGEFTGRPSGGSRGFYATIGSVPLVVDPLPVPKSPFDGRPSGSSRDAVVTGSVTPVGGSSGESRGAYTSMGSVTVSDSVTKSPFDAGGATRADSNGSDSDLPKPVLQGPYFVYTNPLGNS